VKLGSLEDPNCFDSLEVFNFVDCIHYRVVEEVTAGRYQERIIIGYTGQKTASLPILPLVN